jgi:hypothetical protein
MKLVYGRTAGLSTSFECHKSVGFKGFILCFRARRQRFGLLGCFLFCATMSDELIERKGVRPMRIKTFLFPGFVLLGCAFGFGCKPSKSSEVSGAESQVKVVSRSLTDWFLKTGVSEEEKRTVDVIMAEVLADPGYTGDKSDARKMAVFADSKFDMLDLRGKKLSDISPIFALSNLAHLDVAGNNFSPAQLNKLLEMPKLRTFVTDSGFSCPNHPRVHCLN